MNPYEILKEQSDFLFEQGKKLAELAEPKYQTFEEFLKEKHMEDYHGTDDDAPDAFDHWITQLDTQEVMDFAEEWGAKKWAVILHLLVKKNGLV